MVDAGMATAGRDASRLDGRVHEAGVRRGGAAPRLTQVATTCSEERANEDLALLRIDSMSARRLSDPMRPRACCRVDSLVEGSSTGGARPWLRATVPTCMPRTPRRTPGGRSALFRSSTRLRAACRSALTLLALLVVATLAPEAASAVTADLAQVEASDPCVVKSCEVTVTLEPDVPARLQVSFAHAGGPGGFRSGKSASCSPGAACRVSNVLRTTGTRTIAVRVIDETGSMTFATHDVTVRNPPKPGEPGTPEAWDVLCRQANPADKCQDGGGRRTPGGGEKVSHKGWPSITGVFWQVTGSKGRRFTGGPLNDELLGHHGSDRISGKGGRDVLWGDWNPRDNNTWQRDVLDGGPGNDWIYTSHGRNIVRGGAGKDYIWAYYGRGTIDCGPGFDTLRIRLEHKYRYKNCERIKNFCAHGSKPGNKGGCYKPGEKPRTSDPRSRNGSAS